MTDVEQGKVSSGQVVLMYFVFRLFTMAVLLPLVSTGTAGRDSWLSALLVGVWTALITLPMLLLARRFPTEAPAAYLPRVVSRPVAVVIGILFAWYFLHLAVIELRQFADVLNTALLRETPSLLLTGLMLAVVAYAMDQGLEVIARSTQIIASAIIAIALFVLGLSAIHWRLENLAPVLANGWRPVLVTSFSPLGWFAETVIVLFLFPYISDKHTLPGKLYAVIAASAVILAAFGTAAPAMFGAAEAQRQTFVGLTIIRSISVAGFLERLDPLLIVALISGVFVKAGVLLYLAALVLAQTFGLQSYRGLVLPISVLALGFSRIVFESTLEARHFFAPHVMTPYALSITTGLPLLVLAVAALRGQRGGAS
ncbi:MAG: endospore germination permease [Bacillota bacterium]